MKKTVYTALFAVGLALTLAFPARAADEKKIAGEGKCGKCALKQTESCQNVIQVKEDGKTVDYFLVQNDVSKKFHENICKGTKKVTAMGTVKKVDGKWEFTASKIELAKD